MVSCYQKIIVAPPQWEKQAIKLTFEGVGHLADVYINGQHVCHHECGYTAFSCDVSETSLPFVITERIIVAVSASTVTDPLPETLTVRLE